MVKLKQFFVIFCLLIFHFLALSMEKPKRKSKRLSKQSQTELNEIAILQNAVNQPLPEMALQDSTDDEEKEEPGPIEEEEKQLKTTATNSNTTSEQTLRKRGTKTSTTSKLNNSMQNNYSHQPTHASSQAINSFSVSCQCDDCVKYAAAGIGTVAGICTVLVAKAFNNLAKTATANQKALEEILKLLVKK